VKFINTGQQRLFSYGLTLGGLVGFLGGATLAFYNPQFLNHRDVAQLYQDGLSDRGSVVSRDGKQAHAMGMSLMAFSGLAVFGGIFLADGNPKTIRPTVAGPISRPLTQVDTPPPDDVVIAELRENIAQLLHDNPWLCKLMAAPCVVISGVSGCGKTTVANNLAILRSLYWGWDAIVLDPNAASNLSFGSWTCGQVYGGNPAKPGDIEAIRNKAQALMGTDYWLQHPEQKQRKQRLTVIFDELTGWVDGSYDLATEAKRAISWGQRETRRMGYAAIYLPHSLEKESVGGRELESGKIGNFVRFAAVVDLDGKPDEFGEVTWSGTGRFLPPGTSDKAENWQAIAIPDLLSPGALAGQLADVLDYLGKGLTVASEQTVDSPSFRRFRDAMDTAITEDTLNHLAASWNAPLGEYHSAERSPNWEAVKQEPDLWDFVQALTATGPNDVAVIKGGAWAKRTGTRSAEVIRELVERLVAYGCARWTEYTKTGLGAVFHLIDAEGDITHG
jgi:hypothetical protein